MAGSYNHCVDSLTGEFIGTELLDHLGDAYEALEEMYGMIWFLAKGNTDLVEEARLNYKRGIEEFSPNSYRVVGPNFQKALIEGIKSGRIRYVGKGPDPSNPNNRLVHLQILDDDDE